MGTSAAKSKKSCVSKFGRTAFSLIEGGIANIFKIFQVYFRFMKMSATTW